MVYFQKDDKSANESNVCDKFENKYHKLNKKHLYTYRNSTLSEKNWHLLASSWHVFATSHKAQVDLFKRNRNYDINQLCLIIVSCQLMVLHQTDWQVISTNGS